MGTNVVHSTSDRQVRLAYNSVQCKAQVILIARYKQYCNFLSYTTTQKTTTSPFLHVGRLQTRGRHLFVLIPHLLLHDRFGHFALNPDVVDHVVLRIPQRSNKELVPKGCSVGLVVEQTNGSVDTLGNALADHVHRSLVSSGTLQEAAITAQHLVESVSSQVQKALAHVYNGIVGQGGIGNGKVLLRAGQCRH